MTKRYGAALAAFLIFSGLCARTYAAVPGTLSYQGTLRNNGALVTGTVAMEFRITSADGLTQYWTSDSTNVPVSAGLFRYSLGTPNAAQFAAIPWKDITPYVQMVVEGSPFPREPLYASAYAQHARTAESATGTFTAYEGDIRISTSAGSKGLVFQDGTAQYTAAGWSVSGQNTVLSVSGNAGVGVASPQARLDVQAASPAGAAQIWRNSSGVIKASVAASGILYAPGLDVNDADANTTSSGFRFSNFSCSGTAKLTVDASGNLVCASDQTGSGTGNLVDPLFETLDAGTNAGGLGMVNLGSVALGLGTAGSRLDVQGALGAYAQIWRDSSGVEVASLTTSGLFYADAANLRNLPSGADDLGSHTATTNLNLGAFNILNAGGITAAGQVTSYSSVTVAGGSGVSAARLDLTPGVGLSSAPSAQYGGVSVSSHVFLPAGAKYYGDGSGLTALNASNLSAGTVAEGLLPANISRLDGQQVFSGVNTFTSSFTVTSSSGAALARVQLSPAVGLSSAAAAQYGGVYVSSHVFLPAGAVYYGSGAGLTALSATNISAGSLADGRLSANVPLLNSVNTFTSSLTVTSPLGAAANRIQFNSMAGISSTTAANYGGIYISTHVFLPAGAKYYGDGSELTGITSNVVDTLSATLAAGNNAGGTDILNTGNLAVGQAAAVARLDVRASGADAQFWRDSGGTVVSSMSAAGVIYADGSALRNMGGYARLAAPQTFTGANTFVGAGRFEAQDTLIPGLYVSSGLVVANGSLGVGVANPQERLDVAGAIKLGDTAGAAAGTIRFTGGAFQGHTGSGWIAMGGSIVFDNTSLWAVGPTTVYTAGSSSNVAIGTSNSVSSKLLVRGVDSAAGSNALLLEDTLSAQLFRVRNDGNVGVGPVNPEARLDVQGASGGYAQVWRNSLGVEVASITAAGSFYADAANLRNLPSGADGMGGHTATQALNMAGFRVSNASAVNLNPRVELSSTTAANYGGVYVSTHVFLPAGAKYYGDGSGLTGIGGSDNLGNHTLTQNLVTGTNWLSGDGGDEGVYVSPSGNVGIGASGPQEKLEVNGAIKLGDTASALPGTIKYSGSAFLGYNGTGWTAMSGSIVVDNTALWGVGTTTVYTVGASSNVAIGTSNSVSSKLLVRGVDSAAGSNALLLEDTLSAHLFRVRNDGNVGVGPVNPEARLDVQGASGGYSQVWRNSLGVEVASITAAGAFYADAANLRNLPSGADGMGGHTATQALNMAGFRVNDASAVNLNPRVELSSTTAANYGGVYVSTHVFLPAGAKYYGDGSGLTGVNASDSFGSHTATQAVNMAGYDIVSVSTISLSSMTSSGVGIVVSTNLLVMNGNIGINTLLPQARLHVNGKIMSSNLSGFGDQCLYADDTGSVYLSGTGACGSAAGLDGMGNHTMTQNLKTGANLIANSAVSASGISINASDNVGIGLPSAGARLDVQPATADSQFWRTVGGVVIASMSSTGVLYAEASGLRGLTLASTLVDGNSAAGAGITNLGDVAIGRAAATARLDVQASGVNAQFWRNSGGTIVSSMTDAGVLYAEASGLRGLTLATTLADGNNAGGTDITNLGNLGVGRAATANIRLDVQAGGTDLNTQIWRAPDGTIVSSMSAGGVLYAEASGLRGLPSGADGLGVHIATKTLDMDGFSIDAAGDIVASGPVTTYSSMTVAGELGLASPKLALLDNVEISSTSADFHGGIGVQVSSNVFIVGIASATKFYGDGSALTGVTAGSVTGMVNPAIADLVMQGNSITTANSIQANIMGAGTMSAGLIISQVDHLTISADVHVASSVAIGNSIADASTFSALSVYTSYTSPGLNIDNIGIYVRSEMTPPADDLGMTTSGGLFTGTIPENYGFNTGLLRGVYGLAEVRNNANLYYAAGVMGGVMKTNGGTVDKAYGGYFSVNFEEPHIAATINDAYGVYAFNFIKNGLASMTSSYALFVETPQAPPGSITNNFGLYIKDQSGFGSAMSYNIYSAGALSKNYMQGKTGVGVEPSAAVTAPLQLQADSGDGNAIRMNNGAAWCDLRISNATTCPTGTKLGEHNTKSLCLVCSP